MTIHLTPSWVLTDERAECRYGMPVLVNRHEDAVAYGPADIVAFTPSAGGTQPAAHFVHRYAQTCTLTEEKREMAANYLRQWPQGPQMEASGS